SGGIDPPLGREHPHARSRATVGGTVDRASSWITSGLAARPPNRAEPSVASGQRIISLREATQQT
ncbi:hypothetical protein PENSOL_c245G03072, partial [Penicillium solitum]